MTETDSSGRIQSNTIKGKCTWVESGGDQVRRPLPAGSHRLLYVRCNQKWSVIACVKRCQPGRLIRDSGPGPLSGAGIMDSPLLEYPQIRTPRRKGSVQRKPRFWVNSSVVLTEPLLLSFREWWQHSGYPGSRHQAKDQLCQWGCQRIVGKLARLTRSHTQGLSKRPHSIPKGKRPHLCPHSRVPLLLKWYLWWTCICHLLSIGFCTLNTVHFPWVSRVLLSINHPCRATIYPDSCRFVCSHRPGPLPREDELTLSTPSPEDGAGASLYVPRCLL